MTNEHRHVSCQLAIVGTGLAGFAAAVFAGNRGLSTALTGNTGALAYTTGYLDLLGAMDGGGPPLDDPWPAIQSLQTTRPEHPLCRLSPASIRAAFAEFTSFLCGAGLNYSPPGQRNETVLTPAGTLKKTLCMPSTMASGTAALAGRQPCLIADFRGLKGFSARQVVANLGSNWPGLIAARLAFPGMDHGELYPEVMARALEVAATRRQLAELLRKAAGDVTTVGLPAILGIHRPDRVRAELEEMTGLRIFEIPTMPPAVPGIRLRELLEQVLPQRGTTLIPQQKVRSLTFARNHVHLELTDNYGPIVIEAEAVILATGRFLSGGLVADPGGIRESLINLTVRQPGCRSDWFREIYTDRRGHPINRAGLVVDDCCRPLTADGRPFDRRLFAAGIILANQDWIRSRCGAGVAIASACRSVQEVRQLLGG
jgi:glycerol-3-phosphate dehydrogenase subunit B